MRKNAIVITSLLLTGSLLLSLALTTVITNPRLVTTRLQGPIQPMWKQQLRQRLFLRVR